MYCYLFVGLVGREEGRFGDDDLLQACRNRHDSYLLRQAGRHVAPREVSTHAFKLCCELKQVLTVFFTFGARFIPTLVHEFVLFFGRIITKII